MEEKRRAIKKHFYNQLNLTCKGRVPCKAFLCHILVRFSVVIEELCKERFPWETLFCVLVRPDDDANSFTMNGDTHGYSIVQRI